MTFLRTARKTRVQHDQRSFRQPSMSAMAAPVRSRTGVTIGVVHDRRPRFVPADGKRAWRELSDALLKCAEEIEAASGASTLFRKRGRPDSSRKGSTAVSGGSRHHAVTPRAKPDMLASNAASIFRACPPAPLPAHN